MIKTYNSLSGLVHQWPFWDFKFNFPLLMDANKLVSYECSDEGTSY